MAIVVSQTSSSSSGGATTTAGNLLSSVERDIQYEFFSNGGNKDLLLDYLNRTQLRILRASRWNFLESAVLRFVTEAGQTDYWLGTTGSAPAGSVDTSLNLTDLDIVKEDSVVDRSNFRSLLRIEESNPMRILAFEDASSRVGPPRNWRHSIDTPNILNLYPAPDNKNTYRPEPESPQLTSAAGGSLAARTYFIRLSFVDSAGNESTASTVAARQFVPANQLITVKAPQPAFSKSSSGITYSFYNIYASTTEGSETKQNVSTIATTTDWTEPTTGLVVGANPPSTNNLDPVRGYVIEFRYYKTRQQVTDTSQILQVPNNYKDILIAGVNSLTYRFLKKYEESLLWNRTYEDGILQIVRDLNLFPKGNDFIRPDPVSVGFQGTLGA
jgi:hypothetical protein